MDDGIWRSIEQERRSLAVLLTGLSAEQWEAPSLCARWRVRDVAAHLAMTPGREPTLATMTRAMLRNRGDLWGAGCDVAVDYARRPTQQLATELREHAASRAKPVFVNDANILLDLLVHGQDIAVPLGIPHPVDPGDGAAALDRVWSMGWPFHARRRFAGVRLVATDAGWSRGAGPELTGSTGDLLLLATGRTDAALARLDGPGRALLHR